MPTEWVYLVNDSSPEWGYGVTALDFFAGHRDPGMHAWTLARNYKGFAVGDYIWVRATRPLSAFIGLGQVAAELKPGGGSYTFDVFWDDRMCDALSANPVTDVLEKHTQAPRRLTPLELRRLHRAAGSLPKQSTIPAGKIRRTQDVVARQGQADFRVRLMDAYGGRCAVTGSQVLQVLQAAHIEPYNGLPTNTVQNGLLLRADVHDLFDRGLLWISSAMRIAVAPELRHTEYGQLHNRRLKLPVAAKNRPDPAKLRRHRRLIALQQT